MVRFDASFNRRADKAWKGGRMRLGEPEWGYLQTACRMVAAGEVESLPASMSELLAGSVMALTRSIDAKDEYTSGHSERVAFISRWIAVRLARCGRLQRGQVQRIYLAGLLHDIGKIGIPEAVLCKAGPLTEKERGQMQRHPRIGAGIVSQIEQMRDIVPGVLCHHERPDGRGYPEGLMGEGIPLAGRVVMVADSLDAMTSTRAYREAMPLETALGEIEGKLGQQFDTEVGRVVLEGDMEKLMGRMRGREATAAR
jgi:HD-GYP domain-containing protein (c-di-GMP phosphodiesterase class II)